MTDIRRPPLLTLAQAKQVGERLHDRWAAIAGRAPLARDDQAWGDVVQFVLRAADEITSGEPA